MNKFLKSYQKVENSKKYISASGLKIFERAGIKQNMTKMYIKYLTLYNNRMVNS